MSTPSKLRLFFYRHWSFIVTDSRMYIPLLLLVFVFSLVWSFYISNWEPISRFGSIIVIVGAFIGLRRHFRLGSENVENDPPPDVKKHGEQSYQITGEGSREKMFRKGDQKLQVTGLKLAIFGTFLWGYGDAIFQFIYPFCDS